MLIKFKNLIIHNFLSYGHCEINLTDRHYCLVSGVNNDPRDNATSNGAGKSTWGSAACWALTGETIQGLSSNIKNINVDEDLCYVTIDFFVDADHYIITRYKNPKSDLKITLNDVDISGKGIRESEAILSKYLPDLSSQLIASIIILGQGLPYKFSANSPSGRKEVLEKLSKSDFMIQDLKTRLSARQSQLGSDLRKVEDELLSKNSNKTLLSTQKQSHESELADLQAPKDFDEQLSSYQAMIDELTKLISRNSAMIEDAQSKLSGVTERLQNKTQEKADVISEENNQFDAFRSEYLTRKSELTAKVKALQTRIAELQSIKDVCPTCGQKLPNVIKPDVTQELLELENLNASIAELDSKYSAASLEHQTYLKQIETQFADELASINFEFKQLKDKIDLYTKDINLKQNKLTESKTELIKISSAKENLEKNIRKVQETLYNIDLTLKKLDEEILYNINRKEEISKHINIINQMNTLIKRDFRGFLLVNIIDYINIKAKEYALDVFGNDNLDFTLDGNNINISYNGKAFENLSGGEKQRVDLIIQFAIRNMMQQYLNFSSNILILDEIFDQLDTNGCSNILNLISEKLTDIESIFIISHRAGELEIPYDSELIITKDSSGVSTIKWQ